MQYSYTTLFGRSYQSLTAEDRKKIDEAIEEFAGHPYHPYPKGLRVHKLSGVKGAIVGGKKPADVWEMHATMPLLITFQRGGKDEVIFRNCGQHDAVLQNP